MTRSHFRILYGSLERYYWLYRTLYGFKARGSKQHLAKVDEEKVIEIRKLWQIGNLTQEEIANIYKMKKLAIWRIVNYKTWKHVEHKR